MIATFLASFVCSLVCSLQESVVRSAAPGRTPAEASALAGAELRLHDAARLLQSAELAELEAELARSARALAPLQAVEALERLDARRVQADSITKGLLDTVRERMEPRLEEPQRLALLGGGRIALLGSPEQHAWLEAFLARAAAFDGLIDVQTRVYELPRGSLPEAVTRRSGEALTREEGSALVELLARKGLECTLAPRLVVFPFQEARLAVIEQIPYVRDFERKVFPDLASEVADPLVDIAEDGVHLVLRVVPGADGRLGVDTQLDLARVARPIAEAELELGGVKVTIQRPEITHVEVDGCFELAPERPLLLLASADPARAQDVLVLLQAERAPALLEER